MQHETVAAHSEFHRQDAQGARQAPGAGGAPGLTPLDGASLSSAGRGRTNQPNKSTASAVSSIAMFSLSAAVSPCAALIKPRRASAARTTCSSADAPVPAASVHRRTALAAAAVVLLRVDRAGARPAFGAHPVEASSSSPHAALEQRLATARTSQRTCPTVRALRARLGLGEVHHSAHASAQQARKASSPSAPPPRRLRRCARAPSTRPRPTPSR